MKMAKFIVILVLFTFQGRDVLSEETGVNITVPVSTQYGEKSFRSIGCYRDGLPAFRVLPDRNVLTSTNTPERCAQKCYEKGYKYAGTEYRVECFCGDSTPKQSIGYANCNLECSGNVALSCGGENALDVFETGIDDSTPVTVEQPLGCYKDSINDRLLPHQYSMTSRGNTPESCVKLCAVNGYRYAGVEVGVECFCGNLRPTWQLTISNNFCQIPCSGNADQNCGGPDAIQVFRTGIVISNGASA